MASYQRLRVKPLVHPLLLIPQILFTLALVILPFSLSKPVHAATYDPGSLTFNLENQSIWGAGTGITPSGISASQSWNRSTLIGGITGSAWEEITPAIPEILITPEIPSTLITPAVDATYLETWSAKTYEWVSTATWDPATWGDGYWRQTGGCDCYVYTLLTPYIPAVYSPYVPAVYSPAVPAVYGDTRTGATATLSSSGSVAVSGAFGLNGGILDASVNYNSTLAIPDLILDNDFFSLVPTKSLQSNSLTSALPKLEGQIAVNFSVTNNVNITSCIFAAGCTNDSETITDINISPFKLLELNTINVPDKVSLFGLNDAAFDITRMRVFADYLAPSIILALPGVTRPPLATNIGLLDLDYPDLPISTHILLSTDQWKTGRLGNLPKCYST